MDETLILPSEPESEVSCAEELKPDSVMELTVLQLQPKRTIVS